MYKKMEKKLVNTYQVFYHNLNGESTPGMVGLYEHENGTFSWVFCPEGSRGSYENFSSESFQTKDDAIHAAFLWLGYPEDPQSLEQEK